MGLFEQLPYTNFSNLNLSELIKTVKELAAKFDEFKALNTITYGGVWSITKNYPTWTVVTDDVGNGYISIKPVPSGITIDNTSYWLKLYNFVTALGVLETRVTTLESNVSSIGGRVTNVENSVLTLQTALNNLTPRVGHNETAIKNIIKNSFAGHKFLFIGDSWGAGWNAPEGAVKSFETVIAEDLQPDAFYRKDEGGAGFAYPNGHWYGKLMSDWYDENASIANQITDIFIIGGQNDLSDAGVNYVNSNELYECKWCDSFIRSHFPNAKVWVGMVARTSNYNRFATYSNITTTIRKYKEACRVYGWTYINNSDLMVHDYSMIAPNDGAHLTSAGYITLGHYLAESIKNGYWVNPNKGFDAITIRPASETTGELIATNPNACNITQFIASDGVTLQLTEAVFVPYVRSEISCGVVYTMCKYGSATDALSTSPANFFSSLFKIRIPITVLVTYNNGTTSSYMPAYIALDENGLMRIRIMATTQNGQGWVTLSNVTQLVIMPFSHTIPLELC